MVKTVLKVWACSLVLFSSAHVSAQVSSPLQEVKKTVDQIVQVNQSMASEAGEKRREKLRKVIEPRFDFAEMSKRSLGAHWADITENERNEFVSIFSDLLAKTYLNRIEGVTPGMITLDSENLDGTRAVVKTTVENKGDKFPIDYKLMNENGQWKVYDVIIENIGLVANYRNEFSGIIRREKFEGLMKRLHEKVGR